MRHIEGMEEDYELLDEYEHYMENQQDDLYDEMVCEEIEHNGV